MQDQETQAPKKEPNYKRIADHAVVLVDAEKVRIGRPCDETLKVVRKELRKLAKVVDEERAG